MKRQGEKRIRPLAGESIVEVIVAMMVFLMAVAMLQGSVDFAGRALEKSRQIRHDTEAAVAALRGGAGTESTVSTVSLNMVVLEEKPDGSLEKKAGQPFLNGGFAGYLPLMKKEVSYAGADGGAKQMAFYLFGRGTPWKEGNKLENGTGEGYTGFKDKDTAVEDRTVNAPEVVYKTVTPSPP